MEFGTLQIWPSLGASICLGHSVLQTLALIIFNLGFTARQDYFTNFEPSQSLGGAKTGDL